MTGDRLLRLLSRRSRSCVHETESVRRALDMGTL